MATSLLERAKYSFPPLLLSVSAITLAVSVGPVQAQNILQPRSSEYSAELLVPALRMDPRGCPDGWVASSQPGGCAPGSYTAQPQVPDEPLRIVTPMPHVFATPLPIDPCPQDGWEPAAPPLNPQLGCMPTHVAQ